MHLFSPLVEKALRVAARAHCGHARKGSDLPYITHPAGVALILLRAGFDDDAILAAALLHDAVEDTDYSVRQLAAEFPPRVAQYVAILTERKLDEQGRKRSWQERKDEHIAAVRLAPLEARAIVLADKLHNLASIVYDLAENERDVWERFNAPRERVLRYHREMIAAAAQQDDRLRGLADACRELLARLEAVDGPGESGG